MLENKCPVIRFKEKSECEMFLSIEVCDQIQNHFGVNFFQVIKGLTVNDEKFEERLLMVTYFLINSKLEKSEKISVEEIKQQYFSKNYKEEEKKQIQAILINHIQMAVLLCIAKTENENTTDQKSVENKIDKTPIERYLTVGKKMGFTEKEIGEMSFKKFMILWDDYAEYNNLKEPEQESIIDAIGGLW